MTVRMLALCAFLCLGVIGDAQWNKHDTVYFESHGRDDLREWRAAIKKGAQYIKVDFNFQPASQCETQKREPQPAPNGCFVLEHSFCNKTTDYNTTVDILSFINSPANFDVLRAPSRHLIFQMCFKNKPNLCDGSTVAAQWTGLMDNFHKHASKAIAANNLNIEFVFDTLDPDDNCTFSRWLPWKSTYTGDLAEGKPIPQNEVFQMVNMPATPMTLWGELAAAGFLKFANSTYAFVAWEPIDMFTINGIINHYLRYDYVHKPGFLIAYNGDPPMFNTYTSSCTKRFSHNAFGNTHMQNPAMAWVGSPLNVMVSTAVDTNGNTFYAVHERLARGSTALLHYGQVPTNWTTLPGRIVSIGVLAVTSTEATLALANNNGCVMRVRLQAASFNLTALQPTCTAPFGLGQVYFSNSYTHQQQVVASVKDEGGSFSVQTFRASSDLSTITKVSSATVANTAGLVNGYSAVLNASDPTSGSFTLVVSWSVERSTFVSTVTRNSTGNVEVLPSPGSASVKMGVGNYPSVAVDGDHVLLSYGNSFCWNTMLTDDSFDLIYPGIKVCDMSDAKHVEIKEDPILGYVYGPLSALQDRIRGGNVHRNGFASTCDDTLFHGAFDFGYDGAVLLLPALEGDGRDIAPGGRLGVAVSTSLDQPLFAECGAPLPNDGAIVMDTFPLFGHYPHHPTS